MTATRLNPTDDELYRFVSEFVNGTENDGERLPDYLGSLDVFARDVWPRIVAANLPYSWAHELQSVATCDHPALYNADARLRCLALWHTCRGRAAESVMS